MDSDADALLDRPAAPGADTAALLDQVEALYDRGLYVQAWRAGAPLGPLAGWPGLRGELLAGRMANQLGDGWLGARLHLRARRRHPGSGEAWLWALRAAEGRLGPYDAYRRVVAGGPPGAPPEDVEAFRALLAGRLRDFAEAERCLARAEAIAPSDPWIQLHRAFLEDMADGYADALASADRVLARHPWYRPAIEERAHLLVLLGRDDEAMAYLREALEHVEAVGVAVALLNLELEREQFADAARTIDRVEALAPLASRGHRSWIASRRSDVACHLGDRRAAIAHARDSGVPFYEKLAERLEAAGEGARRLVLPVGFVRQHHMTCAPATLAALCAYHGVEAGHLAIADAICYDGTPDHAERRWVAARGLAVREFRVTWEAAHALLDRGLPFTLAAVEPGNAHLQAVVGYDDARGVLLVRDPYFRALIEITEGWLTAHASSGPRGMAIAPAERRAELEALPLPDAALYDLYHAAQLALVQHDRADAARCTDALAAAAPGHRLTLWARRSLASYDGSTEEQLAAIEGLLQLHPDDVDLRVARQGTLAALGRRQERVAYLRAEQRRSPHPLLSVALADAVHDDARDQAEALRRVRLAVRARPQDGLAYHLMADVLWPAGEREEAALAYRLGACLAVGSEHFAEAYFRAERCLGRIEDGLAFLRDRFERAGRKSAGPARTLVDTLMELDRAVDADEVLRRALEWRPDDGELLLFAARTRALAGRAGEADALLARARGAAHPADVGRTQALVHEIRGELAAAAAARLQASALEPLDVGEAEAAARLLADTRDRRAAIAFLRERVERFPNHQGLGRALIGWLDEEPPEARERELRRLIGVAPTDAWALRELALHLSDHGRHDEAFEALARAAAIDPAATALENVRAALCASTGRLDDARAALRASLARDVDQDWAIDRLLSLAPDAAARADDLRFVRDELRRQVTFGDGLLGYQRRADQVLDDAEVMTTLREAHAARPDLWQTWVVLGRALTRRGDVAGARALLEEAAERFPLLPRVWLELGLVHRAAGDPAARRRALERALEVNPGWRDANFELAGLLKAEGDFEGARALLVRALRRMPSDGYLHGWLAEVLLALGRGDEAVEELKRAIRLEPDYDWAIRALTAEAAKPGRPDLLREVADAVVLERSSDPRAWVLASRATRAVPERLAALDRALALAPTCVDAHAYRLELLSKIGRHEEAVAGARAAPWRGRMPSALRLMVIRIEAEHGRKDEATAALRELLAAEPDVLDAWELAAEWHQDAKRWAELRQAADHIVRLAPLRAISHGWAALAALGEGDRAAAKRALARALELSPDYDWGLQRLFDLRLQDGELDAAAALLPAMELHLDQADRLARRVRLAARQDDAAAAAEALDALARCDDAGPVKEAVAAMEAAGWSARVDEVLDAALASTTAGHAVGRVWAVRAWRSGGVGRIDRRLDRAIGAGEGGAALRGALVGHLEVLAERGFPRRVRRWVRRHGERLAADPTLWGTVAYALYTIADHAAVVRWMEGWRGRAGVEPWMLLNLAGARAELEGAAAAAEVSRAALELEPDGSRWRHQLFVALDAVLRGDPAPVRAVSAQRARGEDGSLRALGCALAAALEAPAPGTAIRAARPHLRDAVRLRPGKPGRFLRSYRVAVTAAIARRRAGAAWPAWARWARPVAVGWWYLAAWVAGD